MVKKRRPDFKPRGEQTLRSIQSVLWGHSHYYDEDNVRGHKSRLLDAYLWTDDDGSFILVTRESSARMPYGQPSKRLHRVVTFSKNGDDRLVTRATEYKTGEPAAAFYGRAVQHLINMLPKSPTLRELQEYLHTLGV